MWESENRIEYEDSTYRVREMHISLYAHLDIVGDQCRLRIVLLISASKSIDGVLRGFIAADNRLKVKSDI
jgi:hypothetical protein